MTSGVRTPSPPAGGPDAHEHADRHARLRRVLSPRSVAVVGAGRRHGGIGHEALRALRDYGFSGRLVAVNESGRPVCGVPGYRSVTAVPGPVDLLVVAVPPGDVAGVLTDAGRLGAGGAVILGDPLRERCRQDVLRAAREQDIRLLGPSCLGVLNTDPAVRLNASLAPARPPGGGLAVAVRSGAIGIALLQEAVHDHCGISCLVSLGDEIDISVSDLFGYWSDDPDARAVAVSVESLDDPERFAREARAISRRKPVIAMASGRSDLLAGAGVIRTSGLGETIDTARVLVDQPLPTGNRMAIMGNADGLTMLAAGNARAHGFDVVPLSGSTRAQLPARAGTTRCDNPVDLGVDALPAQLASVAETVAHSDEVDVLLLVLVGNRSNVLAANMAALAPVLDDQPRLAVAAVVTGGTGRPHRLGRRGVPVFGEPERAVVALAHARDYAGWRRHATSSGPRAGSLRTVDVRSLLIEPRPSAATPATAPRHPNLGSAARPLRAP